MPSGFPCTSMVLMGASVFESHIATGLLLLNAWPDLGSTTAPCAAVLGISPAGSGGSGVEGGARGGGAGARDVQAAPARIGINIVKAARATDLGRLEDLVWAGCGL